MLIAKIRMNLFNFLLPNEIDFFKSVDWIIDYYDVKDLLEKDIKL